ncbi:MAG: hypothetical protein ACE5IO_04065 [Thermoplasmata archaeon]
MEDMKTLTLSIAIGMTVLAAGIVGALALSQSQQNAQMMGNDHSIMMGEHEEMYEMCEEHAEEMEEECEEHMQEHEGECHEMMEEHEEMHEMCEEQMHEHEEEHTDEVEHEQYNHDSMCPMMGGMNH